MSSRAVRRARPRWLAALSLVALVVASAWAAGPVHRAVARWGWQDPGEYAQTLRYAVLVAVVAWILVVLRPWRDAPRGAWGLAGEEARPALWPAGFALACGLLLALTLFDAALGWIEWQRGGGAMFRHRLVSGTLSAVAIGFVEETAFRGWVFHAFRRRWAAFPAAALAALVYAVPHAFKGAAAGRDLPSDLSGALEAGRRWLAYAGDVTAFGPKVVGLAVFGMVLTAAYLRTRTLWFGAGIHAGAVFYLKEYGALTEKVPERNWAGTKFLYDGVPAFVLMSLVAWCLWPRAGGRTSAREAVVRPPGGTE